MYWVDNSQAEPPVDEQVTVFGENLSYWCFVSHEAKKAKKRSIYAEVLKEAAEIEARGYVALTGSHYTRVEVNGEVVDWIIGIVSFRSRLKDPGAIKRRELLFEKPKPGSSIGWRAG